MKMLKLLEMITIIKTEHVKTRTFHTENDLQCCEMLYVPCFVKKMEKNAILVTTK